MESRNSGKESLFDGVSRRDLLKGAALVAGAGMATRWVPPAYAWTTPMVAYVGTYTPNGQGIHRFTVAPSNGALTQGSVAAAIPSPSWLAFHPSKLYLYAVNEISNFNGTTTGSVTSFAVDPTTGNLTLLNVVSSQGGGPAHASVDPQGQFVFVANYGAGSVAVLPIQADGSLGNATSVNSISAPIGPTQATDAPPGSFAISGHDAPHAHQILSDPAGQFVLSTDLGEDRVNIWALNRATGQLALNAFYASPPGDGPRHFAFHPNGQWVYLLHEEASTIEFLAYDATAGSLTFVQRISSLPAGFAGTSFASEITVSANGNYVYAANRLHNSVGVFQALSTGRLRRVAFASTRGDYPRSFGVEPFGEFLYACNQRSDDITAFRVGNGGASVQFTGQYIPVGSPACIVFLNLA
jgi:6-phosphogluconolactonase (cycloisomerase 2 family)